MFELESFARVQLYTQRMCGLIKGVLVVKVTTHRVWHFRTLKNKYLKWCQSRLHTASEIL